MARPQTIVLVEGLKPAELRLAPALTRAGFRVLAAGTKKTALARIEEAHPVAIVVDAPSLRFGWERFSAVLQQADYGVPVLVLLHEGQRPNDADDAPPCLYYPFSTRKLIARIEELLADVIQVGDVILCAKDGTLAYHRNQQRLTPKQAQLLEVLMRHPGQTLTRAFLMKQVWDTDYLGDTRTLDVHVRQVRKAIEADPGTPKYLHVVRGVGYRFEEPQHHGSAAESAPSRED